MVRRLSAIRYGGEGVTGTDLGVVDDRLCHDGRDLELLLGGHVDGLCTLALFLFYLLLLVAQTAIVLAIAISASSSSSPATATWDRWCGVVSVVGEL